ncbi:RHS repeat-associated core domain-containing protein [Marivirga tractuosa]|uniref:RHS repeat domain-containing protein n=1 Tax=Marivirga tractuosa TaxID=1006 RepID=UPI0035D03712
MEYHYDQLNRITHGLSLTNYTEGSGFASRDTETASPYDAQYSYDANGNLLNLQRNNEASEIQDDFDYQYYENTNKLRALEEGAADAYIYDEIGNLVEDVQEGTTIEWTPYGKVRTVTKAAENLTINYRYDAAGNRVAKIVDKDGEVTTNRYIRDASGNVMAVYQDTLTLEHHIYGSSRLGLALDKAKPGQLKLGHRQYELSNHLGNVLAVITDNVNMVNSTENSQWYESKAWPTLVKTNDYYPFGLAMGGRTSEFSANDSVAYRYGFNGKEKDVEGMGGGGSTYDYGFRIYNPRIAKFLSVDPLTAEYPWYTPYQFAGNKPIRFIDLDGLEEYDAMQDPYFTAKLVKTYAYDVTLATINFARASQGNNTRVVYKLDENGNQTYEIESIDISDQNPFVTFGHDLLNIVTLIPGGKSVTGSLFARTGGNQVARAGKQLLGAGGTQFHSITLFKQKGSKARIDVENPAPGKRAGQIHYQDENNIKYLYDVDKKKFFGKNAETGDFDVEAPKSVNKLLGDDKIKSAIDKGLKYLGEETN